MSTNSKILAKGKHNGFNDRIWTPSDIVKDIIKWVKPELKILEPFRGAGAFYNELLEYKQFHSHINTHKYMDIDYAEIDEGIDFFDITEHYDYIITNPPYSEFTKVVEHSFKISDNVIMLIPHNKVFTSDKRLDMVENYGTFTYKRFKVPKEWPDKFPIAAYWFKKVDK